MENLIPIIINLVSGAVGGNIAGALLKNFSLGTLWNSVVGIRWGYSVVVSADRFSVRWALQLAAERTWLESLAASPPEPSEAAC